MVKGSDLERALTICYGTASLNVKGCNSDLRGPPGSQKWTLLVSFWVLFCHQSVFRTFPKRVPERPAPGHAFESIYSNFRIVFWVAGGALVAKRVPKASQKGSKSFLNCNLPNHDTMGTSKSLRIVFDKQLCRSPTLQSRESKKGSQASKELLSSFARHGRCKPSLRIKPKVATRRHLL